MCHHNPTWLYPTQEQATNKAKFLFFCLAIGNPFLDTIICDKCGLTGHPIKSRRGGIRWHRNHNDADKKRVMQRASAFWKGAEIEIPDNLRPFLSPDLTG